MYSSIIEDTAQLNLDDIQPRSSSPRHSLNNLVQHITDQELRKAIQNEVHRLISDHDRIVNMLQQRSEILEQEFTHLKSTEENNQRRYEKAVREMQFFKKKYDKANERQLSSSIDSGSIHPLPEMKSRSSSSSSCSSYWSNELPPLPRIPQGEIVQARKASWSSDSPSGLNPSIIQQRKVDPIAFGGSDALWDTIARSKSVDPALEKTISNFLRRGGSPNTAKQSSTFKNIKYGYGMLHAMIAIKATSCIDILIGHGANPNALSMGPTDTMTPAYLAASMGWLPGLQNLIEAGADLMMARGPTNKTALHVAAEHCHVAVVEYIVSSSSSKYHNEEDASGANVLHYAAGSGHADLVGYLVQACRLPVEKADRRGETALHWASRHGHLEVASLLIERYGCDFNTYIPRKLDTPLDYAKAGHHKRLLDYYKKIGALSTKKMEKKREEEVENVPVHLESALSKNGFFGF